MQKKNIDSPNRVLSESFDNNNNMTKKKVFGILADEDFLIRPTDTNKVRWDLLIMILSLFNCFTVPIEVAFEPEFMQNSTIQITNFVIDFIFLCDIVLAFRTVYVDSKGAEVKEPLNIAIQYLKTTFIIDFLATVPWTNILSLLESYRNYVKSLKKSGGNPWIELLGVLKLGRILRLNKII